MDNELFMYVDKLDYSPGDIVSVYASSDIPARAELTLVSPRASGTTESLDFQVHQVDRVPATACDVAYQETINGSFGVAEDVRVDSRGGLSLFLLVWPTRTSGGNQPLFELKNTDRSFGVSLDDGRLTAEVSLPGGGGNVTANKNRLIERQWYAISVVVQDGMLSLLQVPIRSTDPNDQYEESSIPLDVPWAGHYEETLVSIAGSALVDAPNGDLRARNTFDGKIESPLVLPAEPWASGVMTERLKIAATDRSVGVLQDLAHELREGALAGWRFDSGFSSSWVEPVVSGTPALQLVNAPTRGMTGHNWTGDVLDFRFAPEQYGAVHFHTDDLEDAAWTVTAQIQLPNDIESGIYAARLSTGDLEDHAPVFVRRAPASPPKDVLFLTPTFSYIAYANSRLTEKLEYTGGEGALTNLIPKHSYRDKQVLSHPEFGMSLYDHHADGSGNCYSTSLRPIPNMRWDFRHPVQSGPRHFAADITWPAWFESQDIDTDYLSDHGLQESGVESLRGHSIVVTGSHPEYWSGQMLDAMEQYLDEGGSLAYVGGNGFYWVTSSSDDRPHLLEVRRGQQGIRTWEGEPGETTSTQSSEPGGLWRLRGRTPNKLVGVGMAAQGWDDATPGFEITQDAADPRVSRIFQGIEDEIIGDFGLVLGGAAGDEIDRADFALGTPRHTLSIAKSQPHSKYYLAALEELTVPTPRINGSNNPNVRADITFHERSGGGFVLSTSAISWTGSLAWCQFENNVSTFMRNVIGLALEGSGA